MLQNRAHSLEAGVEGPAQTGWTAAFAAAVESDSATEPRLEYVIAAKTAAAKRLDAMPRSMRRRRLLPMASDGGTAFGGVGDEEVVDLAAMPPAGGAMAAWFQIAASSPASRAGGQESARRRLDADVGADRAGIPAEVDGRVPVPVAGHLQPLGERVARPPCYVARLPRA
jgi:hypothetical protein